MQESWEGEREWNKWSLFQYLGSDIHESGRMNKESGHRQWEIRWERHSENFLEKQEDG